MSRKALLINHYSQVTVLMSNNHLLQTSFLHWSTRPKGNRQRAYGRRIFFSLTLSGCSGNTDELPLLLHGGGRPPPPSHTHPQPPHEWEISLVVAKSHVETEHRSLFQGCGTSHMWHLMRSAAWTKVAAFSVELRPTERRLCIYSAEVFRRQIHRYATELSEFHLCLVRGCWWIF